MARAVKTIDRNLMLVAMPGQEVEKAGEKYGLPLIREIYADRAYEDNGNLVSRRLEGAVLHDADVASERVTRMIADGAIISRSGKKLPTRIDSVCVHGDTPGAVSMARRITRAFITGRPSSETPTQPAAFRSPISAICSPFEPRVTAPIG